MTRLLVFLHAIVMTLTTVVPSQAALCKKSNGTVLVCPACSGKLVPLTVADLAGLKGDKGDQGDKGDKGDQGDTGDGPQGPAGPAAEIPPAPVLVSAHATASAPGVITTVYTVPAGQSFTLTDIEFAFSPTGQLTLSDSSGVRLVIRAPLTMDGFCGSGEGSRTYSTGLYFAPGSTITMTVSPRFTGCGIFYADITIMGGLLPAS